MKGTKMHYREAFRRLEAQQTLDVTCPDGVVRKIWGYNPVTGDLFVEGWPGDVWMDCSDGTLRAEFETH